jgi:hypothetical protein
LPFLKWPIGNSHQSAPHQVPQCLSVGYQRFVDRHLIAN